MKGSYLPLLAITGDASEMAAAGAPGLKVKRFLLRAYGLVAESIVHFGQLLQKDLPPSSQLLLTPLVVSLLFLDGADSPTPSSLA